MSYPAPQQQFVSARRPGTATAGAVIAMVQSGLALAGVVLSAIVVLTNRYAIALLDFVGATGTVVVFALIAAGCCVLGLVAAARTLRNSNAWRITTVVFGFLVAAFTAIGVFGNLNEQSTCNSFDCPSSQDGAGAVIFGVIWGGLALLSAVLLLVNGANEFYGQTRPTVYAPAQPAWTTPPGWYPIGDGRLCWWDGQGWTNHFHGSV